MKKFIIINGKDSYMIERETKEQALMIAQNHSDHSKEIIVREVDKFRNLIVSN